MACLFTRLAKRRKSDCAGEGDENVRGWETEWVQAVQRVGLMCVCAHACVCVLFAFVVKESSSQNDLCPAVIYLLGPSEKKPVGVVGSTGTCPHRFIQTPPPQIASEFALSVCY